MTKRSRPLALAARVRAIGRRKYRRLFRRALNARPAGCPAKAYCHEFQWSIQWVRDSEILQRLTDALADFLAAFRVRARE